jgi:hypothetical protein
VVWLGQDPRDDVVSRILLDYYRVATTRERTVQEPLTVAQECGLLRAAHRPAVLSDQPELAVDRRYACVPDLVLVRVPASR